MDYKVGDIVTRNSHNNDIVFIIMNIKDNICYLKGENIRLYADCEISDLKKENADRKDDYLFENPLDEKLDRSEFFYMPAKILHLDFDYFFNIQLQKQAQTLINKGI